MKKMIYNIDGVKKDYKESEEIELKKMYPEIDFKDKYILFVNSVLWFPFQSKTILGDIDFIYDDEIKKYPIKIRKPYPNKTLSTMDMKNKRSVCNYGIPVIFESFEELEKLKCVKIKWLVDTEGENDTKSSFFIKIDYKLNFIREEGKFIYSIYSSDNILDSFERVNAENNKELTEIYISEFDSINVINNLINGDETASYYVKGKILTEDEIMEETLANIGMEGLYNALNDKYTYNIYLYSRAENLEPDTVAKDILHLR